MGLDATFSGTRKGPKVYTGGVPVDISDVARFRVGARLTLSFRLRILSRPFSRQETTSFLA